MPTLHCSLRRITSVVFEKIVIKTFYVETLELLIQQALLTTGEGTGTQEVNSLRKITLSQ